jgi:hypothetical protein
MTYQEMQKAEAELNAALSPAKKQRGATKAQLEHRAKIRHANALCVNCAVPFGMHTLAMTIDCANARS